ncbi:hypothetical protein ACQWFR_25660, partial [Salmonella enterica subsp. enterica serovar Infantis]
VCGSSHGNPHHYFPTGIVNKLMSLNGLFLEGKGRFFYSSPFRHALSLILFKRPIYCYFYMANMLFQEYLLQMNT